jgi:hypothetical protein
MKLYRIGAVAALLLAAGIGFVLGQGGSLQILSPSGSEQVTVQAILPNGQPAALNNFVTVNQIRNSTGYQVLASASGTVASTNSVDNLLVNAQPAASTIFNTPTSPYDGELFAVCNATSVAWATNTVTLAAASGSSLNAGTTTALTTLAAHTKMPKVKESLAYFHLAAAAAMAMLRNRSA